MVLSYKSVRVFFSFLPPNILKKAFIQNDYISWWALNICAFYRAALCVQEKQSQHVRHFHFHGWPEIGIPAEGRGMIDIIAAVQRQQQQSGNRPIIVHCRWGPSLWHFCRWTSYTARYLMDPSTQPLSFPVHLYFSSLYQKRNLNFMDAFLSLSLALSLSLSLPDKCLLQ